DAVRADRVIWTLAAAPTQAFALLRAYLRPVVVDAALVTRLITDLDSDAYEIRQKAMIELNRLGECVVPDLQRSLALAPSLDLHRRLRQLLEQLELKEKLPYSSEKLRTHRAMELLGQISTPEALQLLTGSDKTSGQFGSLLFCLSFPEVLSEPVK